MENIRFQSSFYRITAPYLKVALTQIDSQKGRNSFVLPDADPRTYQPRQLLKSPKELSERFYGTTDGLFDLLKRGSADFATRLW